jgi:hypothetical protein
MYCVFLHASLMERPCAELAQALMSGTVACGTHAAAETYGVIFVHTVHGITHILLRLWFTHPRVVGHQPCKEGQTEAAVVAAAAAVHVTSLALCAQC